LCKTSQCAAITYGENADRGALADTVAKKIDVFANTVQLAAQPEGMQVARGRTRLALAAFDPAAVYSYILILNGSVPDAPVAEHRAGSLMPATALQTFKAQFFRALSHPVRIKILEILIGGDRSVQELQEALKLDQPVVSQQLAVLRNQGIVTSEKKGLSVRYALRDPAIEDLLDVARRIFNNHLVNTRGMLRELQREGRRV
jgi:ArsR family transcriptional regulator